MADTGKTEYDFSSKDPNAVLTKEEMENFDEGMKLKNSSPNSALAKFGKAVQSVVPELNKLFS